MALPEARSPAILRKRLTMADRDAAEQPPADGGQNGLLAELNRLDSAIYGAVAATPTPSLDRTMRGLSQAANYSRLSISSAALLALAGGARGRKAALAGLASVSATSAMVNLVVKPLGRRRRPNRPASTVPGPRHVPMPRSRSFPSGHSAAAVAFASGAGRVLPAASVPLHVLAALVSYSRIHTGVHYPGDVVAGVLIGSAVADAVTAALTRR
jgi:membrane-associated phospholipid phosphatase